MQRRDILGPNRGNRARASLGVVAKREGRGTRILRMGGAASLHLDKRSECSLVRFGPPSLISSNCRIQGLTTLTRYNVFLRIVQHITGEVPPQNDSATLLQFASHCLRGLRRKRELRTYNFRVKDAAAASDDDDAGKNMNDASSVRTRNFVSQRGGGGR